MQELIPFLIGAASALLLPAAIRGTALRLACAAALGAAFAIVSGEVFLTAVSLVVDAVSAVAGHVAVVLVRQTVRRAA